MTTFKAFVVDKKDKDFEAGIKELTPSDLPENEVLVSVAYSSVNYKDGLAVTNSAPVVRNFPLVPGIDLVGTVRESASADYEPGDKVIVTGWSIGEKYWGGFSQMARVKASWLVPLPEEMTPEQAMVIGTAGFTAMLCVMALEAHDITAPKGDVVVTGATGGVGSFAVAILSALGYSVTASTGKADSAGDYLKELGATNIIGRFEPTKRPLDKMLWQGAVDTVGGETLATVLAQIKYGGSVAACGLAASGDLPATVYPFILRGVSLLGVDSVSCPTSRRQKAWLRLNELLSEEMLNLIKERVITLDELPAVSQDILQGKIRGRVVVDLQNS